METIRPSLARYKRVVAGNLALGLAIFGSTVGIALTGENKTNPLLIFVPTLLVLGVGVAGSITLYFRNTRVEFRNGMISRTNMLGATKKWPLSSVKTVLDVPTLVAWGEKPRHSIFVIDASERLVVRMSNIVWTPHQIEQLVEATAIVPLMLNGPTTALSIRSRYPHVVRWREARPFQFATVITIAILVPLVVWFVIVIH